MPALEQFYLPISRIDASKREVEAVIFTQPRVRGCKYNLTYPALKRSVARYMKMPCVREMHQPSAAGKTLSIHCDDATETASVVMRIVDDSAWNKVEEGVYRATSLGGVPLICRGDNVEEFDLIEISLVDRPKDPGALITSIVRAQDALADVEPTLLPESATDADVDIARGEIEAELERLDDVLPIERYDHQQPRDDHGMWTIVSGHRISVTGKAIDHNDIHAAKAKFNLSDEATGALLAAHKAGTLTTDHHLYRTLSHAEAKAGGLHALTTSHIKSGVEHHGVAGSHENHWHSEAHGMAPKTGMGLSMSQPIGAHELKKGDVVHFPAHDGNATIAGVVHKVNPKTVDIGSTAGAAQVGVRVKKDDLKRPGFVKRDHGSGISLLHHVEVARFDEGEFERGALDAMHEHAEAIAAVLSRVEDGNTAEAQNEVAERLRAIARGEADSAIAGNQPIETDSLELERAYNARQPRDDHGKWSDGAGGISSGHAVHVMKSEGIHEKHLHDEVTDKIKSGHFKTREDVLKHIDAIHDARKKGDDKGEKKPDDKEKKPAETDKKPTKSGDKSNKSPEKPKKPAWHHALKKLAQDTTHSFMNGYRKGRDMVGRAEGVDTDSANADVDEIPGLVDEFYDGLGEADDATIAGALRAAIGVFNDGAPEVERAVTSDGAPVRENLEGGAPTSGVAAQIAQLRSRLHAASDDESAHERIVSAIEAALSVLDGKAVARGVGDESPAADSLQRLETIQSDVTRLAGELSTAHSEAQAALCRAEDAEGEVSRLETANDTLKTENQQLRDLPLSKPPFQSGAIGLERAFAVNDALPGHAAVTVRRTQLTAERDTLLRDTDPARGATRAARVSAIEHELARLH